ncbi:MAG: hypothetical protein OXB84_04805, partial [Halobacteriovoraceae bacterium]|nr:hypothetical protein [Halobacteriovoraceae bacterium]
ENSITPPTVLATEKKDHTPAPSTDHKSSTLSTKTKNWRDILTALSALAPISVSYLKQGNILRPIQIQEDKISIKFALPHDGQIFLNYLQDKKTFDKLLANLSSIFNCRKENLDLQLKLLSKEEQKQLNFVSIDKLEQAEKKQIMEKKKENLVNDPLLKQAKKLFHGNIDKIIIHPTMEKNQ